MEGQAPIVPVEQLLSHREWVRRVARSLVRDESTADDLEQGVWLEALERPPRAGRSLRGWLAAALRHDLIDRQRSEKSRTAREHAQPGAASPEPPHRIVAEAEAHKRVVVAVMDLPEPYRSTVLLRYFQDLDSREIALRTGVPDGTVRSRLLRALAMLRERFDRESAGDREAWHLLLTPLGDGGGGGSGGPSSASQGAGPFIGGLLMTATTKVAVGAAVLAVGGLLWWAYLPASRNPSEDEKAEASAPVLADVPPADEGAAAPPPSPPPGPPPPAAAPPEEQRDAPDFPPVRVLPGRLPTLAGIERIPPTMKRLEIEVDERGGVTVGGAPQRMEELSRILREEADSRRDQEAPKASSLDVVLRADRDLPWQGAQWLMQACAHPEIRIYRIHFAGVAEDGATEGAIPAFLPLDTVTTGGDVETKVFVKLNYDSEESPVTAADLRAYLDDRFADQDKAKVKVEVDAAPSVPTGDVLQVVDAIRAWGAKSVVFRGTRVLKEDSIEAAVNRTPQRTGGLAIVVLGTRVRPR